MRSPRVPTRVSEGPLPVGVPLAGALRRAPMLGGHEVLADLQLHQGLGQDPDAQPREVRVALELGLGEQLHKHPQIVGHRRGPPVGHLVNPDKHHTVAVAVSGRPIYTLAGTLPCNNSTNASLTEWSFDLAA